jgi:uncharacterized protein HemX
MPSWQQQQPMPQYDQYGRPMQVPMPPVEQYDQFGRPIIQPPLPSQHKQKKTVKGLAIFVAILGVLCLAAAVYYILM